MKIHENPTEVISNLENSPYQKKQKPHVKRNIEKLENTNKHLYKARKLSSKESERNLSTFCLWRNIL